MSALLFTRRLSTRTLSARRFFSQQSSNPSTQWQQYRPYVATYTVVGVCCSGYAYNFYADDQVQTKRNFSHRNFVDKHLVFTRDNYNAGRWWTLITCSFMHTTILHLGVNMFAFTSFAPLSIMLLGLPSTAALWLGGSISAMYLTMLGHDYKRKLANTGRSWQMTNISSQPLPPRAQASRENTRHLGSSASLLGIITAVACRVPRHGVYLIPIPVPIPLYGASGGFAVFSVVAWEQDLIPFLGHAAHLGGMAFGAAYYVLALRLKRLPRR
ncbi:MAG: hypothetical protein Q9169_001551 [Polycauliona sp. 2 TL-2023]